MSPTYTCANCGETYEKAWTDEEARAESDAMFGTIREEAVVCDDCFQTIHRNWTMAGQPKEPTSSSKSGGSGGEAR